MTSLKNAVDVFSVAATRGLGPLLLQDVFAVSSGSSTILKAIGTQIDAIAAAHLQALMRKDIEHFADAIRDRRLDSSALHSCGIGGAEAWLILPRNCCVTSRGQAIVAERDPGGSALAQRHRRGTGPSARWCHWRNRPPRLDRMRPE